MATTASTIRLPPYFADRLPPDRWMIPALVAAIWVVVFTGFIPSIVLHVRAQGFVYPLIVHLHALAFVGWLILLSVQVTLVETGRTAWHRRLGIAGAALAAAMVILGPSVALIMGRAAFGSPFWDPPFLSIEFAIMLVFAVLVVAALLLRERDAAGHKRLILLATMSLTAAGFGRIFGILLPGLIAPGWAAMVVHVVLGPDLLIAALGIYDVATRGRLQPAYVAGFLWIVLAQAGAILLYFNPMWVRFAWWLLGH